MSVTPPQTFQALIHTLQKFWAERGCVIWLPHHEAVGAGTNNPATILRILGPEPLRIAYVEPSFRPDDGRYAENPNRVQMHHQFQVIVKPIPHNIQDLYLESLEAIGLDLSKHDIRFVEDNWESPVLGAWGLGWEVWLDGMEVTQYTYFQQAGALPLIPPACELTYGLERLAMYVQAKSSLWDLQWNEEATYGELLRSQEISYCRYAFEFADIGRVREMFGLFEAEAESALDAGLPVVAYDFVARCSHAFNILDARGAIALSERVKFFGRIRGLTRRCAEGYLKEREALGFPGIAKLQDTLFEGDVCSQEVESTPKVESAATALLVVEFGVEELASFTLDPIATQLREHLPKGVKESRLDHGEIQVSVTPRRIVFSIAALAREQVAIEERIRGPLKAAIDKNPKALDGFCRKFRVEASAIEYMDEGAGVYAFATVRPSPRSVREIVPEIVQKLVSELNIGRSMRWLSQASEDHRVEFNRPIRWILALFGGEVLPVKYAGLCAGRTTRGPRWARSPSRVLEKADQYYAAMSELQVVVDTNERRSSIAAQIATLARSVGGSVLDADELLDEVTNLVETPTAFLGKFAEEFAELPGVVKKAIIGKHVRCFSIYGAHGEFLPYFIGVKNGPGESLDVVRAGFERVIVARLTDAAFFIGRDNETKLVDLLPRLERLMFHEKLGTMRFKAERVERLALSIAEGFRHPPELLLVVKRAALLAKTDLASQMVTEMTSLQGEMGALYALRDGEPAEIAEAIREHYFPRFAGDSIPKSAAGRAIALADKLDTIVAFLSIGLEPTGSADPFALRREALGVLAIALGAEELVELSSLCERAAEILGVGDKKGVIEQTLNFLEKRLEVSLRDAGLRYDVVRAVLATERARPRRALELGQEIAAMLEDPKLVESLPSFLRCVRLVKKARSEGIAFDVVDESRFIEPIEGELWRGVVALRGQLKSREPLVSHLRRIESLEILITKYFESLMVMDGNLEVRRNRLATVAGVADLLEGYGDLTVLE